MQDKNNNTLAIKVPPLVPPRGLEMIFCALSLSYFTDTETPTRVNWMRTTSS